MIDDATQHLGVLTLALHIPSASSLKEKRTVLKSLKERMRRRFNVSVSEIDGQNKWQVATVCCAMVSADQKRVDRCFQNILSFTERFANLELCEHDIYFY